MDWKKTLLISAVVLLAGGATTTVIFMTEPTATRSGAVRETAMLVDVTEARRGNHRPIIRAVGTVEPSQDVTLSPRVSGEIIRLSPAFTPGGFVRRGEELLKIDPSDYETALQQRKGDLSQALADLSIEIGRQAVARQDYELLGDMLSEQNEALVLREPQLEAARSRVESRRAAVRRAELELDRTTVRAAFDAHILSRNANVGSQVSRGDDLGRLVGLDSYWVVVTVPPAQIRYLEVPDATHSEGSPVTIRNRTAWRQGELREGRVYRLVGALENQTRLARLIVSVSDPYARLAANEGLPLLIIGSFVEVSIEGRELSNVFRVDRDHIRADRTVWVKQDGRLLIRPVDIVFQDADYAYVDGGLEEGDKIVTTSLATVVEGARLRLAHDDTSLNATSPPPAGS